MGGYGADERRVVILDDEDSKEFILAWFEFFKNDFPYLDCFRVNSSEAIRSLIDDNLCVRNGGSYNKPPAAEEMAPVYMRLADKYNCTRIATNPKVWHDMDMDTKVANYIYAYYL